MNETKIKVICDSNKRANIESMLILGGFTLSDDDVNFVLTENSKLVSVLTARDADGERVIIKTDDIEYFESFGHDIYLITTEQEKLKLSEKMYELEAELPPIFIRIGQSVIVHKKQIKKIIPSLFQRFDLIMYSGAKLTVTRGYYYRFREILGI